MNLEVFSELKQDIQKLQLLEDSIITEDHTENRDLRSKQALLISEVIQSLQKVNSMLKAESQVTMIEHQTTFNTV
jgi:hypothetical protein